MKSISLKKAWLTVQTTYRSLSLIIVTTASNNLAVVKSVESLFGDSELGMTH